MIYDDINYSELIRMSENGLVIGSYTQIRDAITKRMKEIYGTDIDLSTASLDGQFVEMLSLMFNNILNTVKTLYTMLDPNQAYGKMLDIICSFSNIVRKDATYSSATITVTNTSSATISTNRLVFVDKNGNEWVWQSDTNVSFASNTPEVLTVYCSTSGPIAATAGWIYSTLENTSFTVEQTEDAIIGMYKENDEQLRARRNDSLAMSGSTTMDALKAALLSNSAISDVYIYNNYENSSITLDSDSAYLDPHSVYVVVRKTGNYQDSDIGSIIYEKMTSGIKTSGLTNAPVSKTKKSYNYDTGTNVNQIVYWYEATPVHPEIVITFTPLPYFDGSSIADTVGNTIIDYMNTMSITDKIDIKLLYAEVIYADPKFRGIPTYTLSDLTIDDNGTPSDEDVDISLTYFDYSTAVYDDTTKTLTIS